MFLSIRDFPKTRAMFRLAQSAIAMLVTIELTSLALEKTDSSNM